MQLNRVEFEVCHPPWVPGIIKKMAVEMEAFAESDALVIVTLETGERFDINRIIKPALDYNNAP